ncbi:MAG: XRE family transcriptional regulator [Rudaea sp.]|uniref:helix-turn-helix domain-containing protein n=1 Tax=Rudaea sp. TaxID=2136325 RepID=UPI0039E72A3E
MTTKAYASVFDAIANTPQEAANLRLRAELMHRIEKHVERKKWTQGEAAKHGGVTQPRMNDLLRGRLSRFSLDALVNIAADMGLRVELRAAA